MAESRQRLSSEKLRLPGDGLTLAAEAIGEAAAPYVLFFHGGGQSRRSWRGAARRVAEAGYRALTVDLRGHGDSDWAADGDYILDAFARDMEQVIQSFDRPVSLVGASRGAQAVLVGAARHQERVSMVMLADAAPQIADDGVERIRRFLRASLRGFESVTEASDALAHYLEQPPAADASGLRKAMREKEGRLYWNWDPATVSPQFLNPPSESELMTEAARVMKRPTVLVRAGQSNVVTADSVAHFRSLTPQLIVVEAPGVGHMLTGDSNDIFAETLIPHLRLYAASLPATSVTVSP